jgi:cytochrome P450
MWSLVIWQNCHQKYQSQVLEKSLRKYPVAPSRVLAKDITVGGYHIPMNIFFNEPEIWENPDVCDPERFSETKNIPNFSMTHFPFSIGPRNCIGQTFSKFESKVWVTVSNILAMLSLIFSIFDYPIECRPR